MSTRTERFEVVPFDAPLGAEIRGLDLARIGEAQGQLVSELLDEHLVLRLRGQALTDPELLRFCRMLGELDPPGPNPYGEPFHKQHPELNVISNVVEDGRPKGNLGYGEAVWHADMTYVDTPPRAAVLYGLEVPEGQGDTWFANMYAAYDALPDDLKVRIEGRVAIHDASHNSAGMLRKGYEEVTDVTRTPGARQPLVRTDPKSGRKALFLGRRPRSYVVGMELAESEELLDRLWAHATRPELTWVQQWKRNDVLMWNNLAVLHRRDAFDPQVRRVMHRAQIKGVENVA